MNKLEKNKMIELLDGMLNENNNFYFLPKEKEWQNIIIRRLDHSQLTDKCILKNNSNVKMSVSLKSNLKKAKSSAVLF